MKYAVLFLLLNFSAIAMTQDVDYNTIFEAISDKKSDFYYPDLVDRFLKGDESLTTDDYRALYYGFTFQEAYKPYEREPLDQEISDLMAQGMNEETLPQLVEKSKDYLKKQPFSLKMNHYLQNFLNPEIDGDEMTILQRQYEGIINAILTSGDGKSLETGYSINYPSDEYMVMRHLNLSPVEHAFETTSDYFSVAENEQGMTGIYFDVYQMAKVGTEQLGIKTIEVADDELPDDGIEVGSEDEINSFIPLGLNLLQKLNVDIDGDKDLDWILVLAKEGEELLSNFAAGDPEPRLIMILQRDEDGLVKEILKSEQVIPCIDCGESNADPFQSLTFEDGLLTLQTKGGTMFIWERTSIFKWKKDQFYLQEETFSSYRKGKKDQAQTDTETSKDFGKLSLGNFNYYKLLQ